MTPWSWTPEVLMVGSSSASTSTPDGGIVSMTYGTADGLTEQMAGGDAAPATAAEQTPNVKLPGVAVNVRASSVPKPSWPASATVNVQPGPGVPSVAVGTVIETTPGVSPPGPVPDPPPG